MDHAAAHVTIGDALAPVTTNLDGTAMPRKPAATVPQAPAADTGFIPVMPVLPHERDESPPSPAPVQPEIAQAQRDVDRGLVDTDCYTKLNKMNPRTTKG